MSLKTRDVDRIWDKFGFTTKDARDKLAWLEYDGQKVIYTKRSLGRGDISGKIAHFIRQQMKLSEADFRGAHKCTVSKERYIEILKEKSCIEAK